MNNIKSFIQYNNKFTNNSLYILAMFFILVFILNEWNLIINIKFPYIHDDLSVISKDTYYRYKLGKEGRWLIYLLYDLCASIPAIFSQIISYLSLFYFGYTCCRQFIDKKWSLFFALALAQSPAFYLGIFCSQTLLSSYMLLASAAFIKNKIDYKLSLLIYGILFNGSLFNYFNLIPLLYLKNIYLKRIKIYQFIAFYLLAFVLGHLVSQIIVYCNFYHLIHLENWRNPNYLLSINDFFINLERLFFNIWNNLCQPDVKIKIYLVSLLIVPQILYIYINRNNFKDSINLIFIYYISVFAIYIQVFYAGLTVAIHTAISLYIGIIFAVIPIFKKYFILAVLLSIISINIFYTYNMGWLKNYKIQNGIYYQEIRNIPVNPKLYKLVFLPTSNQINMISKIILKNNKIKDDFYPYPFCWRPLFVGNGFSNIVVGKKTKDILEENPDLIFINNGLFAYATKNDMLFLTFSSDFCDLPYVYTTTDWSQ